MGGACGWGLWVRVCGLGCVGFSHFGQVRIEGSRRQTLGMSEQSKVTLNSTKKLISWAEFAPSTQKLPKTFLWTLVKCSHLQHYLQGRKHTVVGKTHS